MHPASWLPICLHELQVTYLHRYLTLIFLRFNEHIAKLFTAIEKTESSTSTNDAKKSAEYRDLLSPRDCLSKRSFPNEPDDRRVTTDPLVELKNDKAFSVSVFCLMLSFDMSLENNDKASTYYTIKHMNSA